MSHAQQMAMFNVQPLTSFMGTNALMPTLNENENILSRAPQLPMVSTSVLPPNIPSIPSMYRPQQQPPVSTTQSMVQPNVRPSLFGECKRNQFTFIKCV
jgi:hypothetical protein